MMARCEQGCGACSCLVFCLGGLRVLPFKQADQRMAKEKARRRTAVMTRLEEENATLQVPGLGALLLVLKPALCGLKGDSR